MGFQWLGIRVVKISFENKKDDEFNKMSMSR